MPFGIKMDNAGRRIDFDNIYEYLIKPAVEDAGLVCMRADEEIGTIDVNRSIFSRVLTSDVMIADITTFNPNVLYELGIRHATASRLTYIIAEQQVYIPFDINVIQVLTYKIDHEGRVDLYAVPEIRKKLSFIIAQGLKQPLVNSPIYQYFPDITMKLSEELEKEKGEKQEQFSKELPAGPESPEDAIKTLNEFRAASDWFKIIDYVHTLPDSLRWHPPIAHELALAYNRMGKFGDAVSTIMKLIEKTGRSAASLAILGRIYQQQYTEEKNVRFLDQAITFYTNSFLLETSNYHSGIQAISLLNLKGRSEKQIDALVPLVEKSLTDKIEGGLYDFWDMASLTELYLLKRDWKNALGAANTLKSVSRDEWMLHVIASNLRNYEHRLNKEDRRKLYDVINILGPEESYHHG